MQDALSLCFGINDPIEVFVNPQATTTDARDPVELVLYGHDDCPLCDRLEAMIEPYTRAPHQGSPITLVKRDITTDDRWRRLYGTRIPVLACGGRVILEGRPEADQVAAAMAQLG